VRDKVGHPPIVYLEWVDAGTFGNGWVSEDELKGMATAMVKPIAAAGFVLEDTHDHLIICPVYNGNNGDVVSPFYVRKDAITRRVELRGHGGKVRAVKK